MIPRFAPISGVILHVTSIPQSPPDIELQLPNSPIMPPHVTRKRLRDGSPKPSGSDTPQASGTQTSTPKAKPAPRSRSLFDDLDAIGTPDTSKSEIPHVETSSDEGSELTDLSDIDSDDVPAPKRPKTDEASDDDDEEGIEFEDVAMQAPSQPVRSGDLELTLRRDNRISLTAAFGKKGPSKIERKIRVATHCVHVMFLLWHNAVRNAWLCDEEVQAIMISHVPPRLWDEIDRWRRNSGLEKGQPETRSKAKGQKGKGKETKDMGSAARKLEAGADMSHGDPLVRLMQSLVGWWKQRFKVTAPGIRKWGYMSLERLDRVTKAYKSDGDSTSAFGERIADLESFRLCAQKCEGSRDVGAQLFTALLRGLGMDARMVTNLQPLGFGWNKLEDADPERENVSGQYIPGSTPSGTPVKSGKGGAKGSAKASSTPTRSTRTSKRPASKRQKKTVEDSDEEMGSDLSDSGESSGVEMSEIAKQNMASQRYDKDLDYPHYWTEVRSPVTDKYVPVDALVKKLVGTTRELIESLEPRGSKAEKKRQVIAYVIGFSQDGTAKDVTVRYLKRQMLPGKTKGVRMPLKKVPVHNRHGKVKRYDEYDWFKHAIAGYTRGGEKHPVTEVDQLEDAVDLTPAKVEKKEVKEGEETLQYYKNSQEYVLERHLKREEALLHDAKPVRVFKSKSKGAVKEEPVYLRSDVVHAKSAETWHKQGRAPITGAVPLKQVPYRAATINRQRELAEAEKATGEKVLQGLYGMEQTDWIIPPPIQDGIIPKNEYGYAYRPEDLFDASSNITRNVDLFVEHMCPEGAVHIPYRGTVRVCKRLQIDYAEAVIDFEFGHRMAVPVIQGVVVAEEYYERVMEELAKDEAERTRKEDEKRRKAALGMWRKLLMAMRIANRIKEEYGEIGEGVEVFGHFRDNFPGKAGEQSEGGKVEEGADMAGGFLPEGYDEEPEDGEEAGGGGRTSSFFPVVDEDDEGDDSLLVQDDRLIDEAKESATAADLREEEGLVSGGDADVQAGERPQVGPRRSTRRPGRH